MSRFRQVVTALVAVLCFGQLLAAAETDLLQQLFAELTQKLGEGSP